MGSAVSLAWRRADPKALRKAPAVSARAIAEQLDLATAVPSFDRPIVTLGENEAQRPNFSRVFRLNIPIPPQAWQRAAPSLWGRKGEVLTIEEARKRLIIRTEAKTREYKEYVSKLARITWKGLPLKGCPIVLTMTFYRPLLMGFSEREKAAALAGTLLPITSPDTDNYLKGPKDALKGIVWHDDSQVVEERSSKRYGADPHTEIAIEW